MVVAGVGATILPGSELHAGEPQISLFSVHRKKFGLFTAALLVTILVITLVAVLLSKKPIKHDAVGNPMHSNFSDGGIVAEQRNHETVTDGTGINIEPTSNDNKDHIELTDGGTSNTTIAQFDGNLSSFIFAIDEVLRSSFGAKKCPVGQGLWKLQLVTDDYPWETRWELHTSTSMLASGPPEGTNYERRTTYTGKLCLPVGQYYMRWLDLMGDSICCQHGPGEWTVSMNGEVVLKNSPSDVGIKTKDYPFNVFGSAKGDITGTFLIMPRPYTPELNVELRDGTIFWMINLPVGYTYAENNLVSGVTSITLPTGAEFLSNGTVDMKGDIPIITSGRRFLRKTDNCLANLDGHGSLRGSYYGCHRELADFEGDKTVLAVRVIAADDATTLDETSISNGIFGNGVDAVNMVSQFNSCSYGKFNLIKAKRKSGSNKDSGNVNIFNGVVTVSVPSVNTIEGDGAMRNVITKELNSIFSVNNPSQLADFVIYCLPPGTTPEIAYAYINHWLSVFNDDWCTSMSLQMHEIGHGLSLGHSNEAAVAYEDQTGIMGASYRSNDGPFMCFNGAKSFQLGWYRDKEITINDSGTTNCFDGFLYGIADYSIATTVLLRIQTRTGFDYFVTFNAQHGINSGTQEAGNLVTVTSRPRGPRNSYAESELVAKLDSGGIYNGVLGYKISVGNIDANKGTSEVKVLPTGRVVCNAG